MSARAKDGAEGHLAALSSKLTDVGAGRPVGCLPAKAIRDFLALEPAFVAAALRADGFSTALFEEEDCQAGNGALYVFDASALDRVLRISAGVLAENDWPLVSDAFIARVARERLQPDHPVHGVVSMALGPTLEGQPGRPGSGRSRRTTS